MKTTVLLFWCFLQIVKSGTHKILTLSKDNPTVTITSNIKTQENKNSFEIQFLEKIVTSQKHVFIVVESKIQSLKLEVYNSNESFNSSPQIQLGTINGNMGLVMSKKFLEKKILKSSGNSHFRIKLKEYDEDDISYDYKMIIYVGSEFQLQINKTYQIFKDNEFNKLLALIQYDGTQFPQSQRLRFQTSSIKTSSNYKLESSLEYKSNTFLLNHIFKKTVGGVLTRQDNQNAFCLEQNCEYKMIMNIENVQQFTIESFLVDDNETLDIEHYEGYYDRTSRDNEIVTYKLDYVPQIQGLDISITLIPVNGQSNLYINANSKPLQLAAYSWKEIGQYAKRVTIKADELKSMQLEQNSVTFFITVQSLQKGEFYLNIDAHEQGFRGRLQNGITEGGFVKFEEQNTYIYNFEVFETQNIEFDIHLNIATGNASLFLQQCFDDQECDFDKNDANSIKNESHSSNKIIEHQFECKVQDGQDSQVCTFLITVYGKENHGTHYDISLQEKTFHRLMLPGKSFNIDLMENNKNYLKFSYPSRVTKNELHLSLETNYGKYTVNISRTEEFPNNENKDYQIKIDSEDNNILNQYKDINLSELKEFKSSIFGHYFISIEAESQTEMRLKFFEIQNIIDEHDQQEKKISIHSLIAGKYVQGEISNENNISYYTIRTSLDEDQKEAMVSLTKIKGDFTIYANRNGQLPSPNNHEFMSQDNYLKLPLINQDQKEQQEFIIGVQLAQQENKEDSKYQFTIGFNYQKNAIELPASILSTYFIKQHKNFFIQIKENIETLLILKSTIDGYSIDLCVSFSDNQDIQENEKCDLEAIQRQVSIFIDNSTIQRFCNNKEKCFLHMTIKKGNKNEKYQLGYTFNSKPFVLSQGEIITLPEPLGQNYLSFSFLPDKNKPVNIYFNSKGSRSIILTKIVEANPKDVLVFPTKEEESDFTNDKQSFIQNFLYNEDKLNSLGETPLILIKIQPIHSTIIKEQFRNSQPMLLQISTDSTEIIRTHTHKQLIYKDEWTYFHFYNNGSGENISIYINASQHCQIDTYLTKGLQSRAPMTNGFLEHSHGIKNVQITFDYKKLKTTAVKTDQDPKGYYVIAVRSNKETDIDIFWNNKRTLNYSELTPGNENQLNIVKGKKVYFQFYARDADNENQKGKITMYFRTNIQVDIFVVKNKDDDLLSPSPSYYQWKTNLGHAGGITAIQVNPTDKNYCLECQYIGVIQSQEEGVISILAEIEHQNEFLELKLSSPLPCFLAPHEFKKYKFWNPDADIIDLTISMLSGYADVFISDKDDVSDQVHKERHQIQKTLGLQKLIVVAPAPNYQINQAHEYYMLIKNTGDVSTSLLLNVDKNDQPSIIYPGVKKISRLAPGETTNYYYTPNAKDKLFEVQFELRSVFEQERQQQALQLIDQYVKLYHQNINGPRIELKYKEKYSKGNRVYISFDIQENLSGTFTIHIYNPVNSGVTVAVDLLNGGYRLLNLNQHTLDFLEPNQSKMFEAHGEINSFLYFDMKSCYGDVDISFYETNSQDNKGLVENSKTIKNNNTFLHYLKMTKKNIFIQLQNKNNKQPAYFDLMPYVEKSVSGDPSSEIVQINDGKVSFQTDTQRVVFQALKITSQYEEDFYHKISYTVYLSSSFEVMRYAKNCGEFMFDKLFKDDNLMVFDLNFDLDLVNLSQHIGNIQIQLKDLQPNTKYYGVLVADIQIYPKDLGYLSPLRSNKVFYDEFIFISSKYDIPLTYLIAITLIFGFIFVLFVIVRSYIFGNINKLTQNQLYHLAQDTDESSLGYTVIQAMESDIFKELQQEEEEKERQQKENEETIQEKDLENQVQQEPREIEMTDAQQREAQLTE